MQNKYQISVVIPTYNRANDLMAAIQSVLNQTYPITEILVCDDGSTDNSKELVSNLNNPKVKWLECGENGGPAIPRNTGVKQSIGNWIAFLDNDDEWLNTKIEKQVDLLQHHDAKACCCNASRIKFGEDKGPYLDYKKTEITTLDLMLQNSIICSSALLNKELILETALFPEDKKFIAIEDYCLWLRLSKKTKFLFINENLVKYSDNAEISIRSTNTKDVWDTYSLIFNDFKEWLTQKKISLSSDEKREFKKLTKKIRQKGIETPTDNFLRKLSDKLKIKTIYNS